jgi:hypothetical protein
MIPNQSFIERWKVALKNRQFRIQLTISIVVLATIAFFIPYFFVYIQQRDGMVLNDPLVNLIHPLDVSSFTFAVIYGALLVSIIHLSFFPGRFLLMIQSYCVLTFFRVICIALVPLNNPVGLIVLQDPFVNMIGYEGNVITKDLFFSGHVSTIFLLYLTAASRVLKMILLLAMVTVASLILVQHVHYTIDLLVAPLFSWLAVRTSKFLFMKNEIKFRNDG